LARPRKSLHDDKSTRRHTPTEMLTTRASDTRALLRRKSAAYSSVWHFHWLPHCMLLHALSSMTVAPTRAPGSPYKLLPCPSKTRTPKLQRTGPAGMHRESIRSRRASQEAPIDALNFDGGNWPVICAVFALLTVSSAERTLAVECGPRAREYARLIRGAHTRSANSSRNLCSPNEDF
jgi:hypothetical protein